MKIAISATEKDMENDVDLRFGRCPYFMIVEIEKKEIKDMKVKDNTAAEQLGGAGINAAQIVADEKVDAVITGNMGPRAFDVFNQLGIEVYQGEGKVKKVVQDFIEGKLKKISGPGPMHKGENN